MDAKRLRRLQQLSQKQVPNGQFWLQNMRTQGERFTSSRFWDCDLEWTAIISSKCVNALLWLNQEARRSPIGGWTEAGLIRQQRKHFDRTWQIIRFVEIGQKFCEMMQRTVCAPARKYFYAYLQWEDNSNDSYWALSRGICDHIESVHSRVPLPLGYPCHQEKATIFESIWEEAFLC